jgi:hypothetical protein
MECAIPKATANKLYDGKRGSLTKEKLMNGVSVSDEAMVVVIILVKLPEIIEALGDDDGVSDLSEVHGASTAVDDQSSISQGSKKRKAAGTKNGKKQGGRKKRKQKEETGGVDRELGTAENAKVFRAMEQRIKMARTVRQTDDDGNGWYEAVVEKLEEMSKQAQELQSLLDKSKDEADASKETGPGLMSFHKQLAKQDDRGCGDIPDGFQACGVAASMLREGNYFTI